MNVTLFNRETEYPIVCDWWKSHSWPAMPLDHLPPLGFMASVDGIPAAAGWLYQTDSAFCIFEWIVANPEVRREKRAAALDALIQQAKTAAAEMGFKSIYMSIKHEGLLKRLEGFGFEVTDKGMNSLICSIGGEDGR